MNFANVKFYKSISLWNSEVFFEEKKEIIFVGRSNVGKSSIMNSIFQKKDLVKTSSRPGKTTLVNLFIVENKYYLTDLPWYGFAKLWKEHKDELDWLISWYIEERKKNIKSVVMLIDSKLWAQQKDIDMYKYLLELEIPVTIVLSKIDKLWKDQIQKSIFHTKDNFFWQEVFAVSSFNKIWLKELEKHLKFILVSK